MSNEALDPTSDAARADFSAFAPPLRPQTALRRAITAAYRRAETDCVPLLAVQARLDEDNRRSVSATARTLILSLRGKPHGSVVEDLVQEYSLSSQEGVALMCLAESLLRIPDYQTRDALIRDKISDGDWMAHLGGARSLFVNAATWGLVLTGKLTAPVQENGLMGALTRLVAKFGEPVIRRGVDMAMRMMGEQFVMGETIADALVRAREPETRGFAYSYDMLGEAAMTAGDADRYYQAYEEAIHAIGVSSARRGVYAGPGISIKLSALHPRYSRAQASRVMTELLPRVTTLALLAKRYDIGLNIDAEEADRLELSLDILESLCLDPSLSGWNGMGFVVQAYGKRCPHVIDFIIDLARRSHRRIMVRLVKGAYWDAEIKRAQIEGLDDYPVYTRKLHTDVAYLACARKLLAVKDLVFPQFATHNAQTLAAIYHMAGQEFRVGDYEFQCLHGMGEPLYEEVVGAEKLNRPCRIYAPVGTHETLLAYLVRRLLENGANSSFVHRIADPSISVDELIADPVEAVLGMPVPGLPHQSIALPWDILAPRVNSRGLDLSNEMELEALSHQLVTSAGREWRAAPTGGSAGQARAILNPGNHKDQVGLVVEASSIEVAREIAIAASAAEAWAQTPLSERAACLLRAADALQADMPVLMGLVMREAGKSAPNAIAELREAIDFLRYYAEEALSSLAHARPLGPIACISPWNFPLAIFIGQISAALVAGNPVLAKPAEETPLIAAEAVRILHEAGIPLAVLRLVPGDGHVGSALVGAPEIQGVMFTGSTEVARLIQSTLARRLSREGRPIPLIAETGGQNAMIVDSSALSEQVVADVIASAFDSAGQRCSALRILCLQEDIADRTLLMLKGALAELSIGPSNELSVDIGPVISAEAKAGIDGHIARMRARGYPVTQLPLNAECVDGTFVAPTIIEIPSIPALECEVFGPVLHIVRYARAELPQMIDAINATGYGLTFGLHTRIDETIAEVSARIGAGNLYINRNVIGAVVGVQPFGGRGLSGTGPKAGGPLYLCRLVHGAPDPHRLDAGKAAHETCIQFADWLDHQGAIEDARFARELGARSPLGNAITLPGPVGELNQYALHPRGTILLTPLTTQGLYRQIAMVLASGNTAQTLLPREMQEAFHGLPEAVLARISAIPILEKKGVLAGALIEGEGERIIEIAGSLAALPGPTIPVQAASSEEIASNPQAYRLAMLLEEVVISTNTTAAGGNASLMTLV